MCIIRDDKTFRQMRVNHENSINFEMKCMTARAKTCQILTAMGSLASLPLYQTVWQYQSFTIFSTMAYYLLFVIATWLWKASLSSGCESWPTSLKHLQPRHISCCFQSQNYYEEHPSYLLPSPSHVCPLAFHSTMFFSVFIYNVLFTMFCNFLHRSKTSKPQKLVRFIKQSLELTKGLYMINSMYCGQDICQYFVW